VSDGRTGEMRVDFRQWGWFPEIGTVAFGGDAQDEEDEEEENRDVQNVNEDIDQTADEILAGMRPRR
jgi:hypothetical protein